MSFDQTLSEMSPEDFLLMLIQNGSVKMVLEYSKTHPEAFQGRLSSFKNRPVVFAMITKVDMVKACAQLGLLDSSLQDDEGNTWLHHAMLIISMISNKDLAFKIIETVLSFAEGSIHSSNASNETPLDVFLKNRMFHRDWKEIVQHLLSLQFVGKVYPLSSSINESDIEKEILKVETNVRKEEARQIERKEKRLKESMVIYEKERDEIVKKIQRKYESSLREYRIAQEKAIREEKRLYREKEAKAHREFLEKAKNAQVKKHQPIQKDVFVMEFEA